MFVVIMPLCNRIFCCIFGWYFYVKLGWTLKKNILLSSSRAFSLSTSVENSEATWKKATFIVYLFFILVTMQWWEIGYKSFNSFCFTHNFFDLNFPDYELVSDGKILQTLTLEYLLIFQKQTQIHYVLYIVLRPGGTYGDGWDSSQAFVRQALCSQYAHMKVFTTNSMVGYSTLIIDSFSL